MCKELDEDAAGTPTMPSTVTMRVRSTLRLRCNLQSASEEYDVTWYKDDQRLSPSEKHLFTSDAGGASSLTISHSGLSLCLQLARRACCPLLSYVAYASVTDDDDRRQRPLLVWPLHYVQCRRVSNNKWLK